MVPGMEGSSKGGKKQLGKDTLHVELWASGKIEGTPHGRFGRMMATSSGKGNPRSKSNVVFDDYTYPTGAASLTKELPIGKRIFPSIIYANPGRVFGVPEDFHV